MKFNKEELFPAIYLSADAASNVYQNSFLMYYKLSTASLVIAVMASLDNFEGRALPIISAIFFLASLGCYAYPKFMRFQESWYMARALAESIKTATWRLLMSAEPFNSQDKDSNIKTYTDLLSEFLTANKRIASNLESNYSTNSVITEKMHEILNMTFEDKKKMYQENRINNQKFWYSFKSGQNRKYSKIFLWLTIIFYCASILFLLFRIAEPKLSFLPIDIFAILASSMIGWSEMKKFDELASAYGLTAHEVGIIDSRYKSVNDPQHLSKFVADSENAFSREHTQWAARRDH